jgi:hypothetical protein
VAGLRLFILTALPIGGHVFADYTLEQLRSPLRALRF